MMGLLLAAGPAGPPRLDTDGDGLPSAEEAEKAGALGIPEDKKDR